MAGVTSTGWRKRGAAATRPTLLIDEADTFLGEKEELHGVLNSGHRAGEQVVRTVGDNFEVRAFSTHCPEYEKDGQRRISLGVVADHVLALRQPAKQRAEPAFDDALPF